MDTNAQNKIVRTDLLNIRFGKRIVSDVKIVEIEFPAGQKAPYHKHPCPVIGSIVSGSCLIQVEGEPAKVINAGDAFYEPADIPIIHFDNNSEKEPMKFIAYYLLNGEKELIELLPEK
jgi:quercetin dioxygenase-like cupin family protein